MTLSTVDWVIVAVLGISTLISLRRGFVKEALSLVTWIAAVLIARVFAGQFTVVLAPYIEMDSLRFGASFVVLFIATLMVGGMVNYLVGEFEDDRAQRFGQVAWYVFRVCPRRCYRLGRRRAHALRLACRRG